MTDLETANHIRKYVKSNQELFSWPTDGCGYDQHIKFVQHRNKFLDGGGEFETKDDFVRFCLDYADNLEATATEPPNR